MLTRAFLLAACVSLAPVAAHASDGRIRSVFYTPHTVVTVAGRPNIQSTIVFAADERIENVAIGDSAAWQVTPNKRANVLFVKPQAAKGRTNLTVITDQRTYLFDLVAQPTGAPLYTLEFTYPAPPPAPVEAAKPAAIADATPAARAVTPIENLNFNWTERGSKRLMPRRVFDDGKSIFLAWDEGVTMPAMLSVAPDGTEGPVNYSTKGDLIVVDGVPGRLVLRAGKESTMLDRTPTSTKIAAATIPAIKTAER